MLVIRLARKKKKKYPVYRIVAADKRRAATGKFVEILGNYNPHTKELSIKKDELNGYIQNGAQPSDAVLRLMQKDGIELPKWAEIATKHRKPKKEPEAKEATEEQSEALAEGSDVEATPAEEQHNVDSAEATEATEVAETKATEAAADAAIETAQAEKAEATETPAE